MDEFLLLNKNAWHKRVLTLSVHLYGVVKQAKLMWENRNQINDHLECKARTKVKLVKNPRQQHKMAFSDRLLVSESLNFAF
jgi:hypothetical protein